MAYGIYGVKKEFIGKIDEALKDDMVSRQSIKIRDAKVLGINKEVRYVLVEGSEEAVKRADEIFKPIAEKETGEDAEKAYAAFKAEDENVASGMGFI
ncbi:MAG: hypothetical protein QW204_00580, partial [Thermoplasmata archaeon]